MYTPGIELQDDGVLISVLYERIMSRSEYEKILEKTRHLSGNLGRNTIYIPVSSNDVRAVGKATFLVQGNDPLCSEWMTLRRKAPYVIPCLIQSLRNFSPESTESTKSKIPETIYHVANELQMLIDII